MKNVSITEEWSNCTVHPFKRISWTAIVMGALIGVGLGFLLNVFAVVIGLTAFSMPSSGALTFSIGGLIGIVIGIIVSMGLAGYVAGYLGRLYAPKRNLGIIYGFATWSLALILSAFLTTQLSHYALNYAEDITKVQWEEPESHKNTHAASSAPETAVKATNPQLSPRDLAWSALVVFALFFIGAVSTCVGAHCGMVCRREE